MTELQIGLIGLGAIAIVGIVIYNIWLEYRHRKLARNLLEGTHRDVLLGEEGGALKATEAAEVDRPHEIAPPDVPDTLSATPSGAGDFEPHPYPTEESATLAPPEDFSRIEPTLSRVEPTIGEPLRHDARGPLGFKKADKSGLEPEHLISPLFDYIAAIDMAESVPVSQIIEPQAATLSTIKKPLLWLGLNELSRTWEILNATSPGTFRKIRVALLLANREGAIEENDLSSFHVAMNDLADGLMAIVEMRPRQLALDTAKALDSFCASVDIQIGINLVSMGRPFGGTQIRALAESAGMTIDSEGRFIKLNDEGQILYYLCNQGEAFSSQSIRSLSTNAMTFLLDVPRAPQPENAFDQMVDTARKYADVLKGALVDDNRHPVLDRSLDPIRRQIVEYHRGMLGQKIVPGSYFALRIFSSSGSGVSAPSLQN